MCFVGIGLPSTAANLARRHHAPNSVLVYESGCIGAKPERLPSSIGDGMLSRTADFVVSVPEIFTYWLQAGRIDVGFLGAAQIDRYGNLNTTVVGDYETPTTRLPGAGGAPEIATNCGEVIITLRHTRRAFVPELDFVTSLGHGVDGTVRSQPGVRGQGPTVVITDLGIMRPGAGNEFTLVSVHPGVEVADVQTATGWDLQIADDLEVSQQPTDAELRILRDLQGTGVTGSPG